VVSADSAGSAIQRASGGGITGTTHILPFDKLSPREFERLCLWLVEREEPALPAPSVVEGSLSKGCERAEHLGAAGSEQRLNGRVGNTNLAHCLDAGYNTRRKMMHQYKANSGVMM
jgi:hypothetical protein